MTRRAVGLLAAVISSAWCLPAQAQALAGHPPSESVSSAQSKDAPSLPSETTPRRPDDAPLTFSLRLEGGIRSFRLDGLNDSLAQEGLRTLRSTWPMGGLRAEVSARRLRLALQFGGWNTTAVPGPKQVGFWFSDLSVPLSFEFLRSRRVSLLAGTGPGFGSIGVQPCEARYTEFTRELGGACTQDRLVSRGFWTWSVEAGADIRLAVLRAASLSLTYRIAYLKQIGLGDWETIDTPPGKLAGGPRVDASGLRALIGVGFDLF